MESRNTAGYEGLTLGPRILPDQGKPLAGVQKAETSLYLPLSALSPPRMLSTVWTQLEPAVMVSLPGHRAGDGVDAEGEVKGILMKYNALPCLLLHWPMWPPGWEHVAYHCLPLYRMLFFPGFPWFLVFLGNPYISHLYLAATPWRRSLISFTN